MKGTDGYPHMPILCPLAARQFAGRFWASGGPKFSKMEDSLPRTLTNHHAKFDAASFILTGEICNRTNTQTNNRYMHNLPISVRG